MPNFTCLQSLRLCFCVDLLILSFLGTTIGLNMATHSIIRTVSPTVGAYLYTWFGYSSFGFLGFILNGAVAALVYIRPPPGIK